MFRFESMTFSGPGGGGLRRIGSLIVHSISVFLLGVLACPAASAAADSGAVLPHLTSGKLPLAETERIYLAEIEHRGLALNMRGWPAVSAAIRTADAQKLALFLSPTFEGTILDFAQGKGPQTESLNIRRITATGSPKMTPIPAKREEFAQYLQGLRSQFAKDAQVELLLKSLSPVVREKLEGAWKGSCALRIVGRRADGGQGETMLGLEFNLATVPDVDVITNAVGSQWRIFSRHVRRHPRPCHRRSTSRQFPPAPLPR